MSICERSGIVSADGIQLESCYRISMDTISLEPSALRVLRERVCNIGVIFSDRVASRVPPKNYVRGSSDIDGCDSDASKVLPEGYAEIKDVLKSN